MLRQANAASEALQAQDASVSTEFLEAKIAAAAFFAAHILSQASGLLSTIVLGARHFYEISSDALQPA